MRAARRRRPLRRRPPEELHPRRAGHRLRHPLRPLALGGAGGTGDHPGAAAPGGTPSTTASSSGSASATGDGGFDVFAAAAATDVTPREFVAGFSRRAGARGPTALRQGGNQVVQPRTGLVVVVARPDDHRSGRPVSAAGIGGELVAGGWRRGTQGVRLLGKRHRRRDPLRRNHRRRRPGQPDRVPLRQGADRRRVAGDADAALQTRRLRRRGDRHHPFQRRPPRAPPLRHRLRRQRRLHARRRRSRSTTTRRPTRATWRWPAARAGAGSTTSTSPGRTPTRARPARSPAPPGGSSGRPATTAGVRFAAGRGLAAAASTSRSRTPGAYTLALWLRDEAGNEAPASAVAVPLRLDDVPPGVAFAADAGAGVPDSIRADVSDAHSGPAGGEIHYRRLGADRWTELPAKLRAGDGAGTGAAGRPPARRAGARAPTSSAPTPSTRPATPPRPRAAPTAPR